MKLSYIEKEDINSWMVNKISVSPNLQQKTEETIYKLKQVLTKILQDSDLVKKEKIPNSKGDYKYKITRPLLKEDFITLMKERNDFEYAKAIGGLA